MAHNCIDWTTNPPTRKMPLLILTRGDDHVYTVVPKEFRTLEEVARREFDLGGADIRFSSSCLNLCDGLAARITESAWEHMSRYIGCATVETIGPRAVPPQVLPAAPANAEDEHDPSAKRELPSNTDKGDENEQPDYRGLDGGPNASAKEAVRDDQSTPSDHGNDHNSASAPEDQQEEPREEEVSAIPPRKSRKQRRVVSEDEGEGEDSEREHQAPARSQVPPIASPPKPTQPGKEVKKRRDSGYRSQPDLQSPDEPPHQLYKPIKQEKHESGGGSRPYSYDGPSQSQHEPQTQAQVESSEIHKLMIRVAHRPSKQESKFTTKSTTKVAKVLGAVCKSFDLDVGRATLYLIVSMEDEDGQVENLFPCDRNDTIARAGAERDTESRFLLKIAGEV